MRKLLDQVLAGEQFSDQAMENQPAQPALSSTDFTEEFDLTPQVDEFLSAYNLENDVELGEDKGKLTPEVAQELKETYELFTSETTADKRFEETESRLKEYVQNKIKEAGMEKIANFDISLNKPGSYMGDAYGYDCVLSYPDGEEFDNISLLHYSYEPGIGLGDGATSWNWAAWFGIEESPFHNQDFIDAYDHDQASQALEEFSHDLDRSQAKFDLEAGLKKMKENYSPKYRFHVDLDERGEFRAHVEDPSGEVIYNIANDNEDGTIPQVEDGFMKHGTDIVGLEKYLKQLDIIPNQAEIVED